MNALHVEFRLCIKYAMHRDCHVTMGVLVGLSTLSVGQALGTTCVFMIMHV